MISLLVLTFLGGINSASSMDLLWLSPTSQHLLIHLIDPMTPLLLMLSLNVALADMSCRHFRQKLDNVCPVLKQLWGSSHITDDRCLTCSLTKNKCFCADWYSWLCLLMLGCLLILWHIFLLICWMIGNIMINIRIFMINMGDNDWFTKW